MIVSLLVSLIGTITFENPGVRLELCLQEMSKQAGQSLRCPVSLKDEVLAASFQNQSIDIVKAQLAKVIHGTWTQKDDGWWLTQTGEQKKEESTWARTIRNKILQTQFDQLRAIAPKSEWTIKDAEKYWRGAQEYRKSGNEGIWTPDQKMAFRLTSSESRFAGSFAEKVTPEMFNGDPILGRYTVRGLPGHIELPINMDDALSRFNSEIQMYRQVSQSTESSEEAKYFEVNLQPGEVPIISIEFFDKNWRMVDSGIPSLYLPTKLVAKAEAFPISPETKEILDLMPQFDEGDRSRIMKENAQSAVVKDAIEKFTNATKRDPLGIKQGRCWIDFARFVKKPLLVSMEDDDGTLRPRQVVPTMDQPEFSIGMKREDSDGWVLGRPLNPEFNRGRRVDRTMVERLSKILSGPIPESFESQLQSKPILTYIECYKNRVPNDPFLYDYMNDGSTILGILGGLNAGQLDGLLRGNSLPVSAMPENPRYFLATSAALGLLNQLSPRNSVEILTCPLYCLPNGISGIALSAAMKEEPEFLFFAKPGDPPTNKMSLTSYARIYKDFLSKSETPPGSFFLQKRRILTTTFSLGAKSKSFENTEPGSGALSHSYTWDTLPEPIKTQVLEKLKSLG
jgi:hypothetical protein